MVRNELPISAEDILRRLPHRPPFLLVDKVLEVVPGKKAVAVKTVTDDAETMRSAVGGFSREILVIEAMAQTGALAYAQMEPGEGLAESGSAEVVVTGYLAGLNDVVFHRRPRPGDTLELTLEFVAAMGTMARFAGIAKVRNETVAEAGLTFTVEGVPPK